MEQSWNAREWENPEKTRRPSSSSDPIPTCENLGCDPAGKRTQLALARGKGSSRYTTAVPGLSRPAEGLPHVKWSAEILAALNIEVLRADEGESTCEAAPE
ncbi:hypothetical protein PR048_017826 [Dryococelus australis]|uniref:Uncharacterized protein n=1 Tax=Dryococelus australis TaxID=614101 RepID=A0ABQ9HAQ0_9NEOP|nr:hypothetical protein PR048_017826 [Dryococelus australis]